MRRALTWWTASRVLLVLAVLLIARLGGLGGEPHPLADGTWWLDRLAYWDSYHLVRIADSGYFDPDRTCCDQSWFPAYPLLMRVFRPLAFGHTIGAGILISFLASVACAALLWLVAMELTGRESVARRAIWLMVAAPFGIFFVAVYTESLWLMFALLAWWAGLRRWWWLAGLAASGAVFTRVNGLFLCAGLAVMYLMQLREEGRWHRPRLDLLALGLPVIPIAGYFAWLHAQTGNWNEWHDAHLTGWRRDPTDPWMSIPAQWDSIWATSSPWLSVTRAIDLAVVLGTLALTVYAARRRAWDQFTYLLLSVGVIVTSPNFGSSGRYALTWFPAYLLLAELGERKGWVPKMLIGLGFALTAVITTFFALRHWVG